MATAVLDAGRDRLGPVAQTARESGNWPSCDRGEGQLSAGSSVGPEMENG
ncbi:hypothetical protein [Phormidium tenue]|nr:hypothetical protein [Phormidium tenue]MBD2230659.1 hypothetical protein [Phormidium tenue FACHB-1052]